jgi:endo-1,4-beta-mannosidase
MGATWVRFDIEWGNVQYGSPDKSTWDSYDALVKAIAAHHLEGLGVILFTPQWARDPACSGGAKCPPKDPATFAKFAAEVASRYKAYGVHAWEIWNEENSYDFWATKTDCAAYTALLQATYPAIKKADPDSIVVTGGLAPLKTDNHNISQPDFLSCIYSSGGKAYFDAVGDHPYTYPALPGAGATDAWNRMSASSNSLRGIMLANGDGEKKIWITEFGVPTNGPDPHWYVSEAQQAQTAAASGALYKTYAWAGPFFWYTIKDGSTETTTNENFFGLVRADGSEKPAFETLKNLILSGL